MKKIDDDLGNLDARNHKVKYKLTILIKPYDDDDADGTVVVVMVVVMMMMMMLVRW